MILQKMKQTAEDYLGEKVHKAVITVPAYFNDAQRQATKDAGDVSGLEVVRIINEPTAAALAYGLDKITKTKKSPSMTWAVERLIFRFSNLGEGVFEVKSTNGDTHLGGDDWDQRLIDFLADEFKKQEGIDLRKDPMALQRLKEAAEKAKIELVQFCADSSQSSLHHRDCRRPETLGRHSFAREVSGDHRRLGAALNRIRSRKLSQDAGLNPSQIDEVIMVGGSTRMPRIVDVVANSSAKEPHRGVNPDEVVAVGAAIQGGILGGEVHDVLLLDVTPLSLGIETMGGVTTHLIEANTTIPTRALRFFPRPDSQPSVEIHVLQGERPMAMDNKTIGRFNLDGIPPAPRGVPQIEVTFDIDANGILSVSAKDKATNKEQSIKITHSSSGLSKEEIEKMKSDAKSHADEDKKRREEVDIRNAADALVFQTERQIKELEAKLKPEDKTRLETAVSRVKEALKGTSISEVKSATEDLNNIWQQIAPSLYQDAAQGQPQAEPTGATSNDTTEGKTESADYEVVDDDKKK
jgi:molecular chaperone DnaK